MKIYAILGGDDWADASVKHIVLPKSMDIDEEHAKWKECYSSTYAAQRKSGVLYDYDFYTWLLTHGGRMPDEDELETYWDEL